MVVEHCGKLLDKVQRVMVKKVHILIRDNPKRSLHTSMYSFVIVLFERFTAVETDLRRQSMGLWERLVQALPPKNSEGMPDRPREWIQEYYAQKR